MTDELHRSADQLERRGVRRAAAAEGAVCTVVAAGVVLVSDLGGTEVGLVVALVAGICVFAFSRRAGSAAVRARHSEDA